jgi:hypothetical protein
VFLDLVLAGLRLALGGEMGGQHKRDQSEKRRIAAQHACSLVIEITNIKISGYRNQPAEK